MKPAISVKNISKSYKLGTIGRHTLVDEVRYWWRKSLGHDPMKGFAKLGHNATEARRVDAERTGQEIFWALKDASFDVSHGEIVGIIGKNGAGKSTLLKILSRITEPTSGQIILNGRVGSLLEVGTGFHPELTGRENVVMNGAILGMKKYEIDNKFDQIVDFSGLEQFIDTPVKRYSSGMYVRLAFAVAAHLEPEILVVDEVLAVGDARFQKKCLGKMKDIASHGRTVLFVSHNMAAVSRLCGRVLLLHDGSLINDGVASDIILSYYEQINNEHLDDDCYNGDESCKLLSARVNSLDDVNIREVDIGAGFKIAIKYEILQRINRIFVPNIQVVTESGQTVFCSGFPNIQRMPHGIYNAECHIPEHFLNEGIYSIHIAVTSYSEIGSSGIVHFQLKNKLSLNVIDHKIPSGWNYGYAKTVPGIVRPRLDWCFTHD